MRNCESGVEFRKFSLRCRIPDQAHSGPVRRRYGRTAQTNSPIAVQTPIHAR